MIAPRERVDWTERNAVRSSYRHQNVVVSSNKTRIFMENCYHLLASHEHVGRRKFYFIKCVAQVRWKKLYILWTSSVLKNILTSCIQIVFFYSWLDMAFPTSRHLWPLTLCNISWLLVRKMEASGCILLFLW